MSDSEESSASANVSDSLNDLSTISEEIPTSANTSQALPEGITFMDMSSDKDQSVNQRTLRRSLFDESAASQENTLNIVEPSQLNQSPWTFVCHLESAKYLKFAVEFLSNPELSSQGFGRIDVDVNGFNITVEKLTYYVVGHFLRMNYYVIGHLRLNPARFRCTTPLNGKSFSFLGFSQDVADVEDEATVYLATRKETDTLNIRALTGGQNTRRNFVDMSSNVAEIRKFPDMSLFLKATVPSDDFRFMVDYLLQQQPSQQVSVDIKNNTATLSLGIDYSWTANYPMLRADGSRAMIAGESYSTIFQWTNAGVAETLLKACELNAEFVVLFHAEQPTYIILRFNLWDVGYLEFMRDCAVIVSSTRS